MVGILLATSTLGSFPVDEVTQYRLFAVHIAERYALNIDLFLDVVSCESGWNKNAVGDKDTSHGLLQFHLPEKDWGFSTEQAYDPYFSIAQAGLAWSKGQESRWSCYKLLTKSIYGKET